MRRRPILLMCLAAALAAVLAADPSPLLSLWRDSLEHWERLPPSADATFVLMGDVVPRAMYAAMLAREGRVRLVAMGTPASNAAIELGLSPREDEIACAILQRLGVPDSCVVVLGAKVESTFDEAVAAATWAVQGGLHRVIFVTSSYHSARARWILRRAFARSGVEIHVAAVPAPRVDFAAWWKSEDGLVTVFNETAKSLFYRIRYRGWHA